VRGTDAVGLCIVVLALLVLFLVPREYFIPLTFAATSCMVLVAYYSRTFRTERKPGANQIAAGVASAAVIYAIFYLGASFVSAAHPFGITPSSESSIYGLIVSPSNPLLVQAAVLLFDAAGYESYFRGTLQRRLAPRFSAPAAGVVALVDASIHLAAFYRYPGIALLWAATTFVADLGWGLTYYVTRNLGSSFVSHFVWDLSIFILFPIS
jgi:membrane protease YdiL (CAAX protease family)